MTKTEAARGRPRDASAAQEAILDAAEAVFAEHGFDGARVDAIATSSGYNKGLIYHYFGDKLGLYTAVLGRADEQSSHLALQLFGLLSSNDAMTAGTFRLFLERACAAGFDYFAAHPRILRILAWEEAEGWTTLVKVYRQFDQSDKKRLLATFDQAQRAGVLRPAVSPQLFFHFVYNVCRSYLTSIPLLQLTGLGEGLSTPDALAQVREQIVALIVHGLVADPTSDAAET